MENIVTEVYKVFSFRDGSLTSLSAYPPNKKEYRSGEWAEAEGWVWNAGLGIFAFKNLGQGIEWLYAIEENSQKKHHLYRCITTQFKIVLPEKVFSLVKNGSPLKQADIIKDSLKYMLSDSAKMDAVWCKDIRLAKRIL